MLHKVNSFFKGLLDLPQMLKSEHGSVFAPGFCSIMILPEEIILTKVTNTANEVELEFCISLTYDENNTFKSVLTNAIKQNQLHGVNTSLILTPNFYQLIVTEGLPVPPSEFQAAIRWKITDMLSFPVEDAVIDHFPLPSQKVGGPENLITVVAAQQSYLDPLVNQIEECGLKISAVDIPELALRNITAMYEVDEKTSAIIYIQDHHVDLIITQTQQLFFSRKLDFELNKIDPSVEGENEIQDRLEKLSLDIQRSFDYYQSQWRNPAPTRVLLACVKFSAEDIANYLSTRLSIHLDVLDIKNIVRCNQVLTLEEQGRYLPNIGGALRESVENAYPTN